METLINIFKTLLTLFKAKVGLLVQIIVAFLLPIKTLIFLVGFMIILDTISGIWKARKIGEKITSHKLSKVISKMVLYQIGLISFYAIDKFIMGDIILLLISVPMFLTKMVAIFFVSIEIMSLNENIKQAYGLNFFQLLKKILLRTKEIKDDVVHIADFKTDSGGGDLDHIPEKL